MKEIVLDVFLDKCDEDIVECENLVWRDKSFAKEMLLFEKYMDKHGVGHTYWAFKAVNEACRRAVEERKNGRTG